MELLTRSTDPDWDRVVYVYVDKIKDTSKLVLDSEMYKLLIVEEARMVNEKMDRYFASLEK